jgi:hypothetical protein
MPTDPVQLIAFYLPQFYPTPENDKWWGKGFTEWTNVAKARPLFPRHYQPHVPADLGFYDLRLPQVRQAQAELARAHGIHGFCYYHYWFQGERFLERPLDEVVSSGKPDLPFCLCWANESWTREWDGKPGDVLIRQQYSREDDREHIRWLARIFQDPRYIRVNDKLLFLVFTASELPKPVETTSIWREEIRKMGLGELLLCRVEAYASEYGDPMPLGFDAAVEFQPDYTRLDVVASIWPKAMELVSTPPRKRMLWQIASALGLTRVKYLLGKGLQNRLWEWAIRVGASRSVNVVKAQRKSTWWRLATRLGMSSRAYQDHAIYEYGKFIERMLTKPDVPYRRFPCVLPSWDNSPRKKSNAYIVTDSSPSLYEHWLAQVLGKIRASSIRPKLVFINAWNEWAEGCHLEPDLRHGLGNLQATKRALQESQREWEGARHEL